MSRILPIQPPHPFPEGIWTKDQQNSLVRIWQDIAAFLRNAPDPLTTSTVIATTQVISPTIVTQQIGPEVYADAFSGTNGNDKITAALATIPATGGILYGPSGAQMWTACPWTGVTKPVTFIMGASQTTIPVNCTIPDNIDVVLSQGGIFSVNAGVTLNLQPSASSSLSQHFTGPGSVIIRKATIHTRWFDDGTHSDVALQQAINAVGDMTPVLRGAHIRVDDILTLLNTVVNDRRSAIIDGGGIAAFSSVNPPGCGGLLWNGPANVPMLEVKNTGGGSVIENLRFYGNSTNRPRSAISYVNLPSGSSQGRNIVRNCHIGMMFGDTGFTAFDSLVDGIRVGDPFDGGDGNVNDQFLFDSGFINGCTNAAFRQSGIQNSLAHIRHLNVFAAQYGIQITSTISLHDCFFAGIGSPATPGAVIYTPLNDDYGLQAGPYIWGYDVSGEQISRYIKMDGTAFIDIKGGGFQLQTTHTATDRNVIYGTSNLAQSVKLQDMVVFDIDSVGAWNISMKAAAGQAGPKVCEFHGTATTEPTFDMASQSGYDVHIVGRNRILPATTSDITAGNPIYPVSYNILTGNATEFSNFDPSRFHIPAKALRVGDSQNGAGAFEITAVHFILKPVNGTTSVTAAGIFPANSLVFGLTTRNENGIGVTAGTVRLGSGTNATKWNANLNLAGHATTTMTQWDFTALPGGAANPTPYFTKTAEDVVASVSGGTFNNSGWIHGTAYYIQFLPPPGIF